VQIADNLSLDQLSADTEERLLTLAKEENINIEVGARELTSQRLDQFIRLAEKYGSPILRFVIDGKNYHPHEDEVVSIIKDYVSELQSRNIILAIENHDRFQARTFVHIIESVGSPYVGICLDSVNSIGAGEGIETVVEILGSYTVNLHIKDYIARRVSHMMGFTIEGAPACEGMLPVGWMFEEINKYGKCQSGILELWTPPEATIEETVVKEDQWARTSIKNLRRYIKN
jgi:3-oxoisoapionate decarboxylase